MQSHPWSPAHTHSYPQAHRHFSVGSCTHTGPSPRKKADRPGPRGVVSGPHFILVGIKLYIRAKFSAVTRHPGLTPSWGPGLGPSPHPPPLSPQSRPRGGRGGSQGEGGPAAAPRGPSQAGGELRERQAKGCEGLPECHHWPPLRNPCVQPHISQPRAHHLTPNLYPKLMSKICPSLSLRPQVRGGLPGRVGELFGI